MNIIEKKRGRPKKYKDVKILQKEVEKYIHSCIYTNSYGKDYLIKRYRKKQLVKNLGISMNTFNKYKKDKEFRNAIEIKTIKVESILESMLYNNWRCYYAMDCLIKEFGWIKIKK